MVPRHIAIILDGNRRYARKIGLDLLKGHEHGARKVAEILEWLKELGVKEATFYALSTENLKRSPNEVAALMELFRRGIKKAINDRRIDENKARIRFIGRLELLPKDMQKGMKELMERTKGYSNYFVNFAIGYGGKAEIVEAANRAIADAKAGKISKVDEETFAKYLWLEDEPDLLIRPGGEKRISNFLLWQMAYAEFVFLDKLWPELTKQDIVDSIKEFEKRERRKGK